MEYFLAVGAVLDDGELPIAALEHLRSIGVEIAQEPKTAADHNWQAWINDPDGNKIELMMLAPDSPQSKA